MNVLLITRTYTDGSFEISSIPISSSTSTSVVHLLRQLEDERATRKLFSFTVDVIEGE